MRVLLDTNVVLDVLLDRAPWNADSRAVWQAHFDKSIDAHITASTVTDIFYIARRHAGVERAWTAVRACLDQFFLVPVREVELQTAAALGGSDFEDNLQIASCLSAKLEAIVTRDASGFAHASLTTITPVELLKQLHPAS